MKGEHSGCLLCAAWIHSYLSPCEYWRNLEIDLKLFWIDSCFGLIINCHWCECVILRCHFVWQVDRMILQSLCLHHLQLVLVGKMTWLEYFWLMNMDILIVEPQRLAIVGCVLSLLMFLCSLLCRVVLGVAVTRERKLLAITWLTSS